MSAPGQLFAVSDEAVLLFAADVESADGAAWDTWEKAGLTLRMARGQEMRTVDGLFDEMAAALQFPSYFGENWAAFEECLAESAETAKSRTDVGFVILILNAIEVLVDEPEVQMDYLTEVIETARRNYSEPIDSYPIDLERWNRPAVPFHVVLQAAPQDIAAVRARWKGRGAAVADLELDS